MGIWNWADFYVSITFKEPNKICAPEEVPEFLNGISKNGETELRRDLKKARQQLKQYETKIKNIEEEHKTMLARNGQDRSSRPELDFKTQFELLQKQVEKERQEYKRRFDKLEHENDNIKTERNLLKRTVEELNSDKESLMSQCTAFKAQLSATEDDAIKNEEKDEDELKDQLFKTIDKLTAENAATKIELDLVLKSQQESKNRDTKQLQQLQRELDSQKIKFEDELIQIKCEKAAFEKSLNDSREYFEEEIKSLVEEKTTFQDNYNNMKKHYESELLHYQQLASTREEELGSLKSEVMKIKEDLIAQEPKHREALEDKTEKLRQSENEVRRLEGELAICQLAAQTAEGQAKTLSDQLLTEQQSSREREETRDKELRSTQEVLAKTQREMGQANEKASQLESKFKNVETERDTLKKKMKETEIKIEVLNKKTKEESDKGNQVKDLETALEEALVEREQILEAAEKEIENERNIAIELEQKLMEDFEWKLREVEGEYRTKIKTLEESINTKIHQTEREITRVKDAELTKMCIDARREMEEKLRAERSNLRSTMESSAKSDKEAALNQLTVIKDREIRMLQRSFDDEKKRMNAEIKRLQSQIEQEVAMQVSKCRAEFDQKLYDNNRKHQQNCDKSQEDYDQMKDQMEGQLNRLRAEHMGKCEEYEKRIANLMSGKADTIFQMKEEVETEFGERMENLRDIYRQEIYQQQETYVKDQEKWKATELLLNTKVSEKRREVEENIAYYSAREAEFETKIEELMLRLQEQNAMYIKLQSEFDSYEWWEEGEGPGDHSKDEKKRSRESIATRSRPPSRPPTREEIHRPTIANINESKDDEEEEDYEYGGTSTAPFYSPSRSVLEPPIPSPIHTASPSPSARMVADTDTESPESPPRRGDKSADEVSRSSWQQEESYST